MTSDAEGELSRPASGTPGLRVWTLLLSVLAICAGALLIHQGIAAREGIEADRSFVGQGLLPEWPTETSSANESEGEASVSPHAVEIRSAVLARPAQHVAHEGSTRRLFGIGCMAAGVVFAFFSSLAASRRKLSLVSLLPRLLWAVVAGVALTKMMLHAGSAAATAAEARASFEGALPAVALGCLLLFAWRR